MTTQATLLESEQALGASLVPQNQRNTFLPRHFGGSFLRLESMVYDFAGDFMQGYRGGYWEFYEVSNGAGFLVLADDAPAHLCVSLNGYEGTMSQEAAGITLTLFALSHLSFALDANGASTRQVSEQYHLLRDYALGHAEAAQILAAID